jgi:hypothetical protein
MHQRLWGVLPVLCVGWCMSVPALYGQYYDTKEYARPEGRYLSAGILRREFVPRPSNSLPDSMASRFAALMPMVAFRQGSVELYLGYTRFEERGSHRSAIVFGTQITNDIPLAGSRPGGLVLPLMIAADYTKVESGALQRDDFNLATLGLGAGLRYRLVTPGMEFWIQGVQLFHVAFQGIAAGTGSSLATVAEAGLLLPRVPIGEGVVLTYRVRLQTWSLNDDRFNYRSLYHGPSVGILF